MRRALPLALPLAPSVARARVAAFGAASGAATPAAAAVTPAQLAAVGVHTRPGARLPMALAFRDARGASETLAQAAAGRPLVAVFADYGCTSLCGPALGVVAARLRETGLAAGGDYRLAVLGLDPASTPQEAQAFGEARLGPGAPLERASSLLVGPATAAAAHAVGYGYVFDAQARQYVHPVAAFVLTPDGRVGASLSEIGLTADALRRALTQAGRGEATGWTDRLALVCHDALVAVGRFDRPALAGLRVGGVLTLAALGAGLVWLGRRRAKAAP